MVYFPQKHSSYPITLDFFFMELVYKQLYSIL